jgi:hypothetical protein
MSQSRTTNFVERNADPDQGVSICIPRVFNNINYRRIKQIFINLNWGFVERVDVIPMGQFKRAYVHYAPGRWNTRDREAMQALEAMRNKEEVKILYDDPWFWKIGISVSEKPAEPPKPKPRPQVQIGAHIAAASAASVPVASSSGEDGEVIEA